MGGDDWDYFREKRTERQDKRAATLAKADPTGWSQHTQYHWYRMIEGDKLEYWPSSNKWLFRGKYYRGGLPNWIKEKYNA